MKTLNKKQISKVNTTVFIERSHEIKFPDGYEPFKEKNARAKVALSKMKLPNSFITK